MDAALKRVDGKLRATDVRTMDENLSRSILRERMLGTLSGLFGALSLVLVSVGVYGVMAFQVTRRQKEIGIRMALGARPAQVTGLVLAETAVPVAASLRLRGRVCSGAHGNCLPQVVVRPARGPTPPAAIAARTDHG